MDSKSIKIEFSAGPVLAIGLMSGTSHDGISAAVVEVDECQRPPAKAIVFRTFAYPTAFRLRLLAASSEEQVGADVISSLHFELGALFGRAAISIAKAARVPLAKIAFIGSHGHTFFHLPPRRARRNQTASTLQLGESALIAAITGRPVVADFRPMDMALGGEAAPLAPLAHLWLFAHPRLGRVIQNIGGIGNATYVPPDARLGNPDLIAFDTGPGGMLIDALAHEQTNGRLRFDRDGRLAARGQINEAMLAELMRNRYFKRRPPKSTGREEFGAPFLLEIRRLAHRFRVSGNDLMATVTALTARSIADACRRFIVPRGRVDQLIATGGGSRNPILMKMIATELPGVEVITAEKAGVNGEALEAIAFAILGYEMLHGRQGNIPTVTGASRPALLGKLTLPPTPAK